MWKLSNIIFLNKKYFNKNISEVISELVICFDGHLKQISIPTQAKKYI